MTPASSVLLSWADSFLSCVAGMVADSYFAVCAGRGQEEVKEKRYKNHKCIKMCISVQIKLGYQLLYDIKSKVS